MAIQSPMSLMYDAGEAEGVGEAVTPLAASRRQFIDGDVPPEWGTLRVVDADA